MIDTHSHLFAEEFAEDLPAVIERAKLLEFLKFSCLILMILL